MKKLAIVSGLLLLATATPALATRGWKGEGWYETSSFSTYIQGSYKTYQACIKASARDIKAHPDFNYSCVYLQADPHPDD